ncbi:hypothetical protein GW17_00033158, partial [Ensete ventricosum]
GIYLPCYDIFRNWIEEFTACNAPTLTPYAPLFAGSFARSLACVACSPIELARTRMQVALYLLVNDFLWAMFSLRSGKAPYWAIRTGPPADRYVDRALPGRTAEIGRWQSIKGEIKKRRRRRRIRGETYLHQFPVPRVARRIHRLRTKNCQWVRGEKDRGDIRRRLLLLFGEEGNAASVLGANFSAGFVAGSIAAAATCPLDVAKTRRQIEKDPSRALNMTTRQTLVEVW